MSANGLGQLAERIQLGMGSIRTKVFLDTQVRRTIQEFAKADSGSGIGIIRRSAAKVLPEVIADADSGRDTPGRILLSRPNAEIPNSPCGTGRDDGYAD